MFCPSDDRATLGGVKLGVVVILVTVVASFVLHEIHASPAAACRAYARGSDSVGYLNPCIVGARTRWASTAAFLVAFGGLAVGTRLLIARRR